MTDRDFSLSVSANNLGIPQDVSPIPVLKSKQSRLRGGVLKNNESTPSKIDRWSSSSCGTNSQNDRTSSPAVREPGSSSKVHGNHGRSPVVDHDDDGQGEEYTAVKRMRSEEGLRGCNVR